MKTSTNKAESQHRPGVGIWNNNFVVVHNGNSREALRLVYQDLDEEEWYGDDEISNVEGFQSNYGVAFASLGDDAYLIFVDTDPASTLKWSMSNCIHT